MIANRPDWCIAASAAGACRCRSSCTRTPASCIRARWRLLDQAADIVEKGGIEAWSRVDAEELLGADDAPHYTKSNDILDVWFDSGSTFFHVLRGIAPERARTTTGPEADLYLEGHDQHRGWFHSSLLIACALEGRAPYRGLLTHGFTVDSQGRKMSKSLGNGIDAAGGQRASSAPRSSACGCAATDYSGDIADRRQDPRARGRCLPPHPQHAALPARQHQRLRHREATRCRSADCSRSTATRSRARRSSRPRSSAHYEVYEFHPVVAKLQIVLLGRPGRLLPRRAEGPPLHDRAGLARAPLGADRAVAHHARDAALDGAVPVASPPKRRGRCSRRTSDVDLHRDVSRVPGACRRRRAARQVDALRAIRERRDQGDRRRARRGPGRLVAAGRSRRSRAERRDVRRCSRASATT